MPLTAAKLGISAAIVAPFALAVDGVAAFGSLSHEACLSLLVLGFGSTGAGRCLYIWAISQSGSIKASLVTYIAPLVAMLLGWAVLGESLGPRVLLGGGLIISGVALVMFGGRLRAMLTTLPRVLARRTDVAGAGT